MKIFKSKIEQKLKKPKIEEEKNEKEEDINTIENCTLIQKENFEKSLSFYDLFLVEPTYFHPCKEEEEKK